MKKTITFILGLLMVLGTLAGCAQNTQVSGQAVEGVLAKAPKYVFMFIGDGMGFSQISIAEIFSRKQTDATAVNIKNLSFTQFKSTGTINTFDAESFCPDSASTATAMATGNKTLGGVICMDTGKTVAYKHITDYAKAAGYEVGIISSVSLDHATPACYYANQDARSKYYDIALQIPDSGFNYFAGGAFLQPKGKEKDKEDILEVVKKAGYNVVSDINAIKSLKSDADKVIALAPENNLDDDAAMLYEIDRRKMEASGEATISLADFVRTGINVMDNGKGFFMMCEGGKIEWACHANDAATSIYDTLAFSDAVQVAVDFAAKHPDETLIVVTGDHETGGLSIGFAGTAYSTYLEQIGSQKMSYLNFDDKISAMREAKATFETEGLKSVKENFGLLSASTAKDGKNDTMVLTEDETARLKAAYDMSMQPEEERKLTEADKLLYGSYEPFSVTATHILNNKSGIGWTSYSHTGLPIPVYAQGSGEKLFVGAYDNTEIFDKLMSIMHLTEDKESKAA